jgi:excinuclease UvrABC nuclease subunit
MKDMNIETTPYYINVSTNGTPFYVQGDVVCEEQMIMLKNHKKQTGLYYLFDKGRIVYIGASGRNVYERILSHIKDKKFDSYFIFPCTDDNGVVNEKLLNRCLDAEAKLIRKFNPEYNQLSNCALKRISN